MVQVACLGEALVLLPALDAGLAGARPAGAEVNVASGLVAAGVTAAWVGRLGADPEGDFLRGELAARGIDGSAVEIDPVRPTGCYAKEPTPDGTVMHYRRAGSAAAAMDPAFLTGRSVLESAAIVHTSGITAALSPSCAAMMLVLCTRPRSTLLTFDVNWREQMWPSGDPAALVELAGLADVVLVGTDEAERVFGTGDPAAVRDLLPRPRLLVLKDGARRAVAVDRNGSTVEVPALRVEVVEPVGAGDAFAAGLLAGLVHGDPVARCLRRGHLGAAAVLTSREDSAPPLPAAATLLDAPDAEWARAEVTVEVA